MEREGLEELLDDYVARFNEGVESGDFAAMLELLATDTELRFSGVPIGPFVGRTAIARAYAAGPPEDQIKLVSVQTSVSVMGDNDEVIGEYAWARKPTVTAGLITLNVNDGMIASVDIAYYSD